MEARGGRLLVRVRDRGMGIPAAEQQEIFGKFVRGAASKAASIAGTGIGLAMAREIVRAHGGDITVESEPGAGSTFTVALPVAEPASAPGRFAARAGVERARARWTLVGVGFTREKQDSRDKTQS